MHVIRIYSVRFTPVITPLSYIINVVLLRALEHVEWVLYKRYSIHVLIYENNQINPHAASILENNRG